MAGVIIAVDSPARADVRALLGEHLADMYATSPPESVHALDPTALLAATAVLARLLELAAERGTAGSASRPVPQDFFATARRLYAQHGFAECGPFGRYRIDPHSVFMALELPAAQG